MNASRLDYKTDLRTRINDLRFTKLKNSLSSKIVNQFFLFFNPKLPKSLFLNVRLYIARLKKSDPL